MTINIHHGDCLEVMKGIPDGSVDMVMCDPPYGTTKCKWDAPIPFEPMWKQLKRVIKKNGAIVLCAFQPFTSALVMSNVKMFKYCWVWEKPQGTNFLQVKEQPLRVHEDICIFSHSASTFSINGSMAYNPQMTTGVPYTSGGGDSGETSGSWKKVRTKNKGTRYPKSIIKFKSDKTKVHPTQKPVALMEYMVKTYTNEGETVLDFTMGSGTTGVACQNLGRSFIGIELDDNYFKIAESRLGLTDKQKRKLEAMKNIELTYTFETNDEVIEFLKSMEASTTPAPVVPAPATMPPVLP